jgi:hypothetical protein
MRPMFPRRFRVSVVLVPLILGSLGLLHLMSEPRFAAMRTVDVVRLTGCGMCFGVALVGLMQYLRGPKE